VPVVKKTVEHRTDGSGVAQQFSPVLGYLPLGGSVEAGVGPAFFPAIKIRLRFF
jgi:hypothetical protein